MNRTWRGDGGKYICYAIASFCVCILFVCATGLYVGHRNVSRITPVLRTEGFGAVFLIIALCFWCLTFHFIYKARVASNKWRRHVRFRPEGYYTAAAYNLVYLPELDDNLQTGTFGDRAIKERPRPKKGRRGNNMSYRSGFMTPNMRSGMATPSFMQPPPVRPPPSGGQMTPNYPPPMAPPPGAGGPSGYPPQAPQTSGYSQRPPTATQGPPPRMYPPSSVMSSDSTDASSQPRTQPQRGMYVPRMTAPTPSRPAPMPPPSASLSGSRQQLQLESSYVAGVRNSAHTDL